MSDLPPCLDNFEPFAHACCTGCLRLAIVLGDSAHIAASFLQAFLLIRAPCGLPVTLTGLFGSVGPSLLVFFSESFTWPSPRAVDRHVAPYTCTSQPRQPSTHNSCQSLTTPVVTTTGPHHAQVYSCSSLNLKRRNGRFMRLAN